MSEEPDNGKTAQEDAQSATPEGTGGTPRRSARPRKTAAARTPRRKREEEAAASGDAAVSQTESAGSPAKSAAPKARVPRDVPCEWSPEPGGPSPAPDRAAARPAKSAAKEEPMNDDRQDVTPGRDRPPQDAEERRQAPDRAAAPSSGRDERRDGPADGGMPGERPGEGGAPFDGPGDSRRDRYQRPERFANRRPPDGRDSRGDQGGGHPGYRGGRRPSRHEMRRMSRRDRSAVRTQEDPYDPQHLPAVPAPRPDAPPPVRMSQLQALDAPVLLEQAESLGIVDDLPSLKKHDLVFELLKQHAGRGGLVIGEGVLETMNDGTGFLRNAFNHYHTSPEDPFVLPAIIRRFGLRPGDTVAGPTRPPQGPKDRRFTLVNVETVNGLTPAEARRVTAFESLTPLFPDRRIHLETTREEVAMRVTNLFTPIGFGQRGLIVAPPRTGKTVLLQKIANAISANHPKAHLVILLIDERPEEVTDMQRNTQAHVLSSTFDEPPERHVQVADIVIEMARRRVEMGQDVIILLDSITRLARAYNTLQPNSGKILSGGVDANALQKPKRFFGAARNIEGGGSLTIVATALVDTGSRMDEVIFEEFKGTGNMELCLDRSLVDKRVFPAINIEKSGTRKEELLLHSEELARTWLLRRALNGVQPVEAMEMIVKRLKSTATNAEFLMSMKE